MVLETLGHAGVLRAAGLEQAWLDRLRDVSADAASARAQAGKAAALVEALTQSLLPAAAALMAALGAMRVMEGTMTAGALVGAIMLGWRLLLPLQGAMLAAGRLGQVRGALRQLDRLLALREEPRPARDAPMPRPRGHALRLEGVALRGAGAGFALAQISLDFPEGARIAITGGSGAGKSMLLRVAAGLLTPQAGAVTLGGVHLAQFPPAQLHACIALLPQRPRLIYGSVAQNLRLSAPAATDAELARACQQVGVLGLVEGLPRGFATRLGDLEKDMLPRGLRQGIAIAQALLRRPRILLLDDPTAGLDEQEASRFRQLLQQLHGHVTVVLATQQAGLIAGSDATHALFQGRLLPGQPAAAPPPQAAPQPSRVVAAMPLRTKTAAL